MYIGTHACVLFVEKLLAATLEIRRELNAQRLFSRYNNDYNFYRNVTFFFFPKTVRKIPPPAKPDEVKNQKKKNPVESLGGGTNIGTAKAADKERDGDGVGLGVKRSRAAS